MNSNHNNHMDNSYSLNKNIQNHIFYFVIAYIMVRLLLYSPIPGFSGTASKIVLLFVFLVSGVLSCGYRHFTKEDETHAMTDSFVPAGVYCFLSLSHLYVFLWIVPVIGVLGILALVAIEIRKIRFNGHIYVPSGEDADVVACKFFMNSLKSLGSKCILVVVICSMLVITPGVYSCATNFGMFTADEKIDHQVYFDESWIEANYDVLRSVRSSTLWASMDEREKLEVLQVVVDNVSLSKGIPFHITVAVGSSTFSDLGVAGVYYPTTNELVISYDVLMSENGYWPMYCVLHEVYHAYEYSLLNLYNEIPEEYRSLDIFDHCVAYDYESKHYSSCLNGQNIEDYENQYLEADANEFADYESAAICSRIDELRSLSISNEI